MALAVAVGWAGSARAQVAYTYPDLVGRVTDLEALAVLPLRGETSGLASTYDRRSRYDPVHDRYLAWGANGDGAGYVRMEGDRKVLADIHGAGCIWRIRTGRAADGHVKVYLDGSKVPAIDLPFRQYFDRSVAPFTRPNLVYRVSPGPPGSGRAGNINYTPIPFQKSCLVIADPGYGGPAGCEFTYTLFPAGTVVPTFAMALSPAGAGALDRADQLLGRCGQDPAAPRPGQTSMAGQLVVPAGANRILAELPGPGAITGLKLKLKLPAAEEAQQVLLRQLTLSIRWDGETAPAVWAPLGDFFGAIGGSEPHRSLPLGMMEDGTLYSYWYMPFQQGARIALGNDGPKPIMLTWEIVAAPLDRPASAFGRFHAKWHRTVFPPRTDRAPDWMLLQTVGRGRFVGTELHVVRNWEPWWGEGDNKFFVDGEKFPSTFGTGSEDYFGYAWGSRPLFAYPFTGQPLNDAHNTSNYRYHLADSVPFQQSFEGAIEKYIPDDAACQYAATVYWYLAPGGRDPFAAQPLSDRLDYWLNPRTDPNLIEGEGMSHGKGTLLRKLCWMWDLNAGLDAPVLLSGGCAVVWIGTHPRDHTDMRFTVARSGCYRLWMRCIQEPAGGTFHFALNGADLGRPVDFYAPQWTAPPGPLDLGTVELGAGAQTLTAVFDGGAAADRNRAVIDFIRLEPLPGPSPPRP